MQRLTDVDWDLLEQIDDGETVVLPPDSAVRLMAAKFIILRHDRKPLITGLGRDAVLRKQYNFAPPSADGPPARLSVEPPEAAPALRSAPRVVTATAADGPAGS